MFHCLLQAVVRTFVEAGTNFICAPHSVFQLDCSYESDLFSHISAQWRSQKKNGRGQIFDDFKGTMQYKYIYKLDYIFKTSLNFGIQTLKIGGGAWPLSSSPSYAYISASLLQTNQLLNPPCPCLTVRIKNKVNLKKWSGQWESLYRTVVTIHVQYNASLSYLKLFFISPVFKIIAKATIVPTVIWKSVWNIFQSFC